MGGEASWAGAGMLAPGGEIDEASEWAVFALENLRIYPSFIAELEEEAGQKIDYQRRGAIEIARTEAEWASLRTRTAAQAKLGISACHMSPGELRRAVPLAQPNLAGALFYPEDAHVDPRHVPLDEVEDAVEQGQQRGDRHLLVVHDGPLRASCRSSAWRSPRD